MVITTKYYNILGLQPRKITYYKKGRNDFTTIKSVNLPLILYHFIHINPCSNPSSIK